MAKYKSDDLDNVCGEMLGHTNWGYIESYSGKQFEKLKKDHDIDCIVVFFKDPDPDEDIDWEEARDQPYDW